MNIKKITLYLLLLVQFTSLTSKANNGHFSKSNVESGITSAAAAQKLLIVHFMADWCMPSQWMERNTFQEAPIHQLLKQHFLAIRVDVDAKEGHQDMETYQISSLPTILVFSPSGEELVRLAGITDAPKLLEHLNRLDISKLKGKVPSLPATSKLSASLPAIDFSHLDRPAMIPNTASVHQNERITPSAPTPVFASNKANFYGVEVASLQQYSAVIRYVRNLESRLSQKVFIQLSKVGEQKSYRVIVGKFPQRREAYQLLSFLKQQQIRGKLTEFE